MTIRKMAIHVAVVSGIFITAHQAVAQSSVTLYGLADVSVRYLTNTDANNVSRVFMTNGATTESRFGLTGTEDLGNGLKAVFKLENSFNVQDGTFGDSQRLFSRQAYVGLTSQYGSLTLGRQQTPLFEILGDIYDPLTVGNYFENAWLPIGLGGAFTDDNSIKYVGTFQGLTVDALYSFGTNVEAAGASGFSGQIPGHLGAGSAWGFTLSYVAGPLSVAAGAQQNSDNSNNKQTVFNADLVYAFSSVKVYLGYLHSKDDTGFVDSVLAQQTIVPDISMLKGTGRIDNGPFTGVNWRVTPALALTSALYYDHMQNATFAQGVLGSGNRYTFVEFAEYSLSKSTEVYGEFDYDRVSGAATVELPGRNNQTGASIGIRHFF